MFLGQSGKRGIKSKENARDFADSLVDLELRSRVNRHLMKNRTLFGMKESELRKTVARRGLNGSNKKFLLYYVVRAASAHYDYDTLSGALDEVPKDIYKKSLKIVANDFCFAWLISSGWMVDRYSASCAMFSYALEFMELDELLDLLCKISDSNVSGYNVNFEHFFKVVEAHNSIDWKDYPIEWTLNALL